MVNLLVTLCPLAQITYRDLKLFSNPIDATGIIVLGILIGALATWAAIALVRWLRQRRIDKLPPILGDPKQLMEQAGTVIDLTMTERYLLNKLAYKLRLPQPVSILLSPALLVQAAQLWNRTHQFRAARQWGITHLDHVGGKIYAVNIRQLTQMLRATQSPEKE